MATSVIAAIERIAPGSVHERAARTVEGENRRHWGYGAVVSLLGVLVALRRDVEAGYMQTIQELVHADVFSDFLEMATELQRSG
jgi:hypothetical protein